MQGSPSQDGQERHAGPGEVVTIPAGVPHYFWNGGDKEAHYMQEFRPALQSDRFFETLFGLARDGKLNAAGYPRLPGHPAPSIAYAMVVSRGMARPTSQAAANSSCRKRWRASARIESRSA